MGVGGILDRIKAVFAKSHRWRYGAEVTLTYDILACFKPGDIGIIILDHGMEVLVRFASLANEEFHWLDKSQVSLIEEGQT